MFTVNLSWLNYNPDWLRRTAVDIANSYIRRSDVRDELSNAEPGLDRCTILGIEPPALNEGTEEFSLAADEVPGIWVASYRAELEDNDGWLLRLEQLNHSTDGAFQIELDGFFVMSTYIRAPTEERARNVLIAIIAWVKAGIEELRADLYPLADELTDQFLNKGGHKVDSVAPTSLGTDRRLCT